MEGKSNACLAELNHLTLLTSLDKQIPDAKLLCKTRENFNFLKKGKMVISVKIQKFSRSRMTKRTSPLESSSEI